MRPFLLSFTADLGLRTAGPVPRHYAAKPAPSRSRAAQRFSRYARATLYHSREEGREMPNESLAELVRFAPDVYGVRWVNHVAMFVATNAGVILVDANGQI